MILVAGGTGRLGSLVVERLIERGEPVRVLARSAASVPAGVELAIGDVRDAGAVATAVNGCDLVVSAVHGFVGPRGISPATIDRDGNANITDAAAASGAELVLISVVGASPDSPMELFRMKHAAERHVAATKIRATIVRATAFFELWIELLRHTAGRSGHPLVFGRGDNPINFVSVRDVAALVDFVSADRSSRGETLEIGGPENLTFNELAAAVQAADGRTARPRHVPPVALRFAAATIGHIKPQVGRQSRAALAMDVTDLTADPGSSRGRYPELPLTSLGDVLSPSLSV